MCGTEREQECERLAKRRDPFGCGAAGWVRRRSAAYDSKDARRRPCWRCLRSDRSSSRPEAGTAPRTGNARHDRRHREFDGHLLRGRCTRTCQPLFDSRPPWRPLMGCILLRIRMIVNCIGATAPCGPLGPPPACRRPCQDQRSAATIEHRAKRGHCYSEPRAARSSAKAGSRVFATTPEIAC